jgi:hypothetical protein
MSPDFIKLTEIPRALSALGTPITYQQAWNAVVEGRIPAERVGRSWHIRKSDLPGIAQSLTDQ